MNRIAFSRVSSFDTTDSGNMNMLSTVNSWDGKSLVWTVRASGHTLSLFPLTSENYLLTENFPVLCYISYGLGKRISEHILSIGRVAALYNFPVTATVLLEDPSTKDCIIYKGFCP